MKTRLGLKRHEIPLRSVLFAIVLVSVGFPSGSYAQPSFKWARFQDGFGKDDFINALDIDSSGNIYVAGFVTNASNNSDLFVARYSPSGTRQWYQTYDHGGNDQATSIALRGSSLYITGSSQSRAGFGGDYDILSFVIDTAGTIRIDSTNERRYDFGSLHYDDKGIRIIPGAGGSFFVAGLHRDSISTADHFTILKYDSTGLIREGSYSNGGEDELVDMSLVDDSVLYVTGSTYLPQSTTYVYTTIKSNAQLQQEWVRTYSHEYLNRPTALFADRTGVYVTGNSVASCGDMDVATVKYAPDGTEDWVARSFECAYTQVSGGGIIAGNNYVYATGYHANGSQVFKYSKSTGEFLMTPMSALQSYWNTVTIQDGTGRIFAAGNRIYYDQPYNAWHLAEFSSDGSLIADVLFDGSGVGNINTMAKMKASNVDSSLVMVGSTTVGNQQDMMIVKYGAGGTFFLDGVFDHGNLEGMQAVDRGYRLEQNYPNPFNPSTVICYNVPRSSWVTLSIYDVLGREVARPIQENKAPGAYSVTWNAETVPSGVYFCRLIAGDFVQTKKMVLMR